MEDLLGRCLARAGWERKVGEGERVGGEKKRSVREKGEGGKENEREG